MGHGRVVTDIDGDVASQGLAVVLVAAMQDHLLLNVSVSTDADRRDVTSDHGAREDRGPPAMSTSPMTRANGDAMAPAWIVGVFPL